MNKLKVFLILLSVSMLILVPTINAFAYIGDYSEGTNATKIVVNNSFSNNEEANLAAAALGVAVGVAAGVAFVVGVTDGWASIHPKPDKERTISRQFEFQENAYDFSKFDN